VVRARRDMAELSDQAGGGDRRARYRTPAPPENLKVLPRDHVLGARDPANVTVGLSWRPADVDTVCRVAVIDRAGLDDRVAKIAKFPIAAEPLIAAAPTHEVVVPLTRSRCGRVLVPVVR